MKGLKRCIWTVALAWCFASGCNLFEAVEEQPGAAPDGGHDDVLAVEPDAEASNDVDSIRDAGEGDVSVPIDDASSSDGGDGGGALCGNGVVDPGEECDGAAESTCHDLDFDGGQTACTSECRLDTSDCYTCDYFVDPESGSDLNDGRTAQSAFAGDSSFLEQLFVPTNPGRMRPGEHLCFKRGTQTVLLRDIDIEVTGAEDAPLVFASYGDPEEAPPVIIGSHLVAASSWQDLGNGVWFSDDVTAPVTHVWFGDQLLTDPATSTAVGDGDFFSDGTGMWLRAPGAAVSGVDVRAVRDEIFDVGSDGATRDTRFIHFRDLHFAWGGEAIELDSVAYPIADIKISNCEFEHVEEAVRIHGQGKGVSRVTVEGNRAANLVAFVLATTESNERIVDLTIRANQVDSSLGQSRNQSLIRVEAPAGLRVSENTLLRGPIATGSAAAVALRTDLDGLAQDSVIARNYIQDYNAGFDFLEYGASSDLRGLQFVNNIVVGTSVGADLDFVDADGSSLVANNTFLANGVGARLSADNGVSVTNNIVVASGPSQRYLHLLGSVAAAAQIIDHNLYVPQSRLFQDDAGTWSFQEWRTRHASFDVASLLENDAQLVESSPTRPEEALPRMDSPAIDGGTDVGLMVDFGGRPVDPNGVDIGAWQRQPGDD